MDDRTSSSSVSAEEPASEHSATTPSSATAGTEHRQAYGTAKTENLRDSGLWRILLPAAVVIFCLALLAIPLIILIWLLSNALLALGTGNQGEAQLTWVWIVMIVVIVGLVAVIIRGLFNTFMTQAGNYHK